MLLPRRVLPDRVKELREDQGLTLDALAQRVDPEAKNKGYLSRIENGRAKPTAIYLAKIAHALGVDINDISTRQPMNAEPERDAA